MKPSSSLGALGLALTLLAPLAGKSLLPTETIPLDSLAGFQAPGANWVLASDIAGDPRHSAELLTVPGHGLLVNVAPKATGENLITDWEHGDLELSFEFLMPQGSNSGVYLMGRYEIQLFDSWGIADPSVHDCGAVYERWLTEEKRGYEGTPPRVNATRAPGLWQTMRIVFQAPRFDQSGKKIANARFREVEHNGFLIHQNVEVTGPTRGAKWNQEAASGPLLIQGNHGPVAFRHIIKRSLDFSARVTVDNLRSTVTRQKVTADYDAPPSSEAPQPTVAVKSINPAGLGENNNFTAVYSGVITVPYSGTYAFDADSRGNLTMQVAGQPVLVPINPGVRAVPIELTAGDHPFQLEYAHGRWGKPGLTLYVEGPRLPRQKIGSKSAVAPQAQVKGLTAATADEEEPAPAVASKKADKFTLSAPADGIRIQRGFTPFDPRKRLYSVSVGSSTGVHYAYDFDTATILRVWNGPFLDTSEFWDGRAHNQLLNPTGPALTFHDKPTVALLESGEHDWPQETDALWSSDGYTLDGRGQPTFFSRLSDIEIEDNIVTASAPRRLERRLTLRGNHTSWMTGILLAEGSSITLQPDGLSYLVGDREYYVDVASGNRNTPFVRHINGRDQLILFPPKSGQEVNLSYSIVW